MAYFGNEERSRHGGGLNTRMVLLVGWLFVCVALLTYFTLVVNGSKGLVSETEVSAAEPIRPVAPVIAMDNVLVPIVKIKSGEKLTSHLFKMEQRAVQGIEYKVIRNFEEIENSYAASFIAPDAPLLRDYITSAAPVVANPVTAKIPEGFRGVTIAVNEESAVEGWVRPGAKVDVVWATTLRSRAMVTTIVENAEVLSAERSYVPKKEEEAGEPHIVPSHITLLVSLKDAQKIQVAKASGTLSLNLRGLGDEKEQGSETITADRLLRNAAGDGDENSMQDWIQVEGRQFAVGNKGELVAVADKQADAKFEFQIKAPEPQQIQQQPHQISVAPQFSNRSRSHRPIRTRDSRFGSE